MASTTELPAGTGAWSYLGEGLANALFRYAGPPSALSGRLLRVRKAAASAGSASQPVKPVDLSHYDLLGVDRSESGWLSGCLGRALSSLGLRASLPSYERVAIADPLWSELEALRPVGRSIIGDRVQSARLGAQSLERSLRGGYLVSDGTALALGASSSGRRQSLEFKLKSAVRSHGSALCYYCGLQYYKKCHGDISSIAEFCPGELLSSDEATIRSGVRGLLSTHPALSVDGHRSERLLESEEDIETILSGIFLGSRFWSQIHSVLRSSTFDLAEISALLERLPSGGLSERERSTLLSHAVCRSLQDCSYLITFSREAHALPSAPADTPRLLMPDGSCVYYRVSVLDTDAKPLGWVSLYQKREREVAEAIVSLSARFPKVCHGEAASPHPLA